MADPFCGCCQPLSPATPLTIFNRPGLSEIGFRVGTFASFRVAMLDGIAGQASLAGLTTRESDDYAITVLELFAATGDVLTFYNERIANELFLRTARERDSLARLTRLIGYRLRPGLAAQTLLGFMLDAGSQTRIKKRLKVMSVPGQDEKPQIFETTEEIVADAALNEAPAFAPPLAFDGLAKGAAGGPIVARPERLAVGEKILMYGRNELEEKTVTALTVRTDGDALSFTPPVQTGAWSSAVARVAKLLGRLRFFGHNAPANVNVFVPGSPPATWPSWVSQAVDASLPALTTAYPLDARVTDVAAGSQLIIDSGSSGEPRLRSAVVVRSNDGPAQLGGVEQLSDTVTHLTLRQTIAGRPALAGHPAGVHSVFARSLTGGVYSLDTPGAAPRRWTYRDLSAATADPQALALDAARQDIFVRDAALALNQRRIASGVWDGWVNHGGVLTSRPCPVVEAGGQVLVFVRGKDLGLWVIDVTAGTPGTWSDLGGKLTSAPTSVSPTPGVFAVFARGLDRAVWHRVRSGGTWSPWTSLGGTLASEPTVTSTGAGPIDLAALDDSGTLIHRRFDGTAWGDWRNLGGELAGAVALVAGAPDRLDVFARGREGALWTIARIGGAWSDWISLDGNIAGIPAAIRDVSGLHVYARGGDDAITSRTLTGGAWSTWATHGDGIGDIPDRRSSAIYRIEPMEVVFRSYDYPAKIATGQIALRPPEGATTVGNLAKGRRILLQSGQRLHEAIVSATYPFAATAGTPPDHLYVDFTPAPATPLADVSLLGNVAAASHGETQPLEALGHGDGARAFQAFRLSRPNLTHLQTGAGTKGAAALEIRVNGDLWREAPSFYGRRPTERLYTARQNDLAETVVTFGDGKTGARLPSGAMNVTATYRTGLGLEGMVKAGQLSIPLERPVGLRGVTNPLAAWGAADPETRDDARTAAPDSVRTFGRAVSLADFQSIAIATGLAARAAVTWVWSEVERAVHVTVAGPGGAPLAAPSLAHLRSALDAARDPNRPLLLGNVVRVPIVVAARLLREPGAEADAMLEDARARLLTLFAFDAMPLGEAVFSSSIYATLQGAAGVVAVDIDLFHLKQHANLTPVERAIRAVDAAPLQPHVRIFPARTTPPPALIDRYARAGFEGPPPPVLAAEQAWIEDPATDVALTAVEAF